MTDCKHWAVEGALHYCSVDYARVCRMCPKYAPAKKTPEEDGPLEGQVDLFEEVPDGKIQE